QHPLRNPGSLAAGSREKMNAQLNHEFASPAQAVQALVAEHGLLRVALALAGLVASPAGHRARVREGDIPDRLRRDIGLEPLPPARSHWDL
ncbi:MAG: hypothetical protein ACK414_16470, partial [Gemmobacter sp.]